MLEEIDGHIYWVIRNSNGSIKSKDGRDPAPEIIPRTRPLDEQEDQIRSLLTTNLTDEDKDVLLKFIAKKLLTPADTHAILRIDQPTPRGREA